MSDKRRVLLAIFLAIGMHVLMLAAGELFIRGSQQEVPAPQKTFSIVNIVIDKSDRDASTSSAQATSSANLIRTERVDFPKDAEFIEASTVESSVISETIVRTSTSSVQALNLVPAENSSIDSTFAQHTEFIDTRNTELAEAHRAELAEAEKNKLLEMIYTLIEKEKQYPALARRRNIEGQVDVMIAVSSSGELLDSAIASSSGSAILDQAAIALIKKIFPIKVILQSEREITITIRYSLE